MRPLPLLFAALLSLSTSVNAAPNAQTVLDQYAKAIGPVDQIQSRRVAMRLIGAAPFELPVTVEARRPNLIHKEVTIQDTVQVMAFDGKVAWKIDPFVPGGSVPFAMTGDEANALIEEAEFDDALIGPAGRGIKVAYLGDALVDGKAAQSLRVTRPNGKTSTVWLDAATHLELKRTQLGPVMGQMKQIDILSSDYRVVDGIKLPHKIEIGLSGAKERMTIVVEKVELNVKLDPSRFAKPAAR
ncbi:hypothetical protein [Massilia sp. CF038]|uniref:hypothetical protein n=1 Tax=Massilia sp. CF038 TaxID=1881045 RepID=UPI00090F7951|nr:hypothetical protein [Massilia sp. CF038]SHH11012.1 hypothetical protein SAMN05428948_2819 [Massilia sp. CF038]